MIDHHVNRPGVYVQQCTQLTGPNRPNDSHNNVTRARHHTMPNTMHSNHRHNSTHNPTRTRPALNRAGLRRPGGHGGGTTPDPIPNSDVKTTSAYDTAPQGAGKSVAARSSQPSKQQSYTQYTHTNAGWSSPVARQAHNLKVTGSNPVPAKPNS